jgi:hypothetical protein
MSRRSSFPWFPLPNIKGIIAQKAGQRVPAESQKCQAALKKQDGPAPVFGGNRKYPQLLTTDYIICYGLAARGNARFLWERL